MPARARESIKPLTRSTRFDGALAGRWISTSESGGMTRILGVDPGAVSGGLAIVEINDGAAPQFIAATDLPTIGVKAKQRIDVLALRDWIRQHKPDHAYIERGQAMPRQGASS